MQLISQPVIVLQTVSYLTKYIVPLSQGTRTTSSRRIKHSPNRSHADPLMRAPSRGHNCSSRENGKGHIARALFDFGRTMCFAAGGRSNQRLRPCGCVRREECICDPRGLAPTIFLTAASLARTSECARYGFSFRRARGALLTRRNSIWFYGREVFFSRWLGARR